MRSNGFMTYENIIKYYENIADTVGQTFYNEDARIKYINEDNKGVHRYEGNHSGRRLRHPALPADKGHLQAAAPSL